MRATAAGILFKIREIALHESQCRSMIQSHCLLLLPQSHSAASSSFSNHHGQVLNISGFTSINDISASVKNLEASGFSREQAKIIVKVIYKDKRNSDVYNDTIVSVKKLVDSGLTMEQAQAIIVEANESYIFEGDDKIDAKLVVILENN